MLKSISRLFILLGLVAPLLLTGCSGNSSATAEENMKRVGLLMAIYTSEHNETYPDLSTPDAIKADLAPVLAKKQADEPDRNWSDAVFTDPLSGQPFVPNPSLARLYAGKIGSPMNVIAFYAPEPSDGKRLVGYADGHVEWIEESQWPIKKIGGMVK